MEDSSHHEKSKPPQLSPQTNYCPPLASGKIHASFRLNSFIKIINFKFNFILVMLLFLYLLVTRSWTKLSTSEYPPVFAFSLASNEICSLFSWCLRFIKFFLQARCPRILLYDCDLTHIGYYSSPRDCAEHSCCGGARERRWCLLRFIILIRTLRERDWGSLNYDSARSTPQHTAHQCKRT